jgi:DNA helicase-4
MKNKNQIYKKLNSNKSISKPVVIIYTNNIKRTLLKLIDKIDTNILLLGRNNKDINDYFNNIDENGYINNKLRYLTIHKSKGLEEDNVIIINTKDDILGFPSKLENNKIINYVLNEKDSYPYEEERRLFYVALTRTKNKVYLLVNKNSESIFVKEIVKNCKNNIQIIDKLL